MVVINHEDKKLKDVLMNKCFDFVVLGPGPGILNDYKKQSHFIEKYIFGKKALIGICLGHQMIGDIMGFQVKRY